MNWRSHVGSRCRVGRLLCIRRSPTLADGVATETQVANSVQNETTVAKKCSAGTSDSCCSRGNPSSDDERSQTENCKCTRKA